MIGSFDSPSAGDQQIERRLRDRGFVITRFADTTTSAAANGVSAVIISSSSRGTLLAGTFRDVAVPVISMKVSVFDDMGLTGPERSVDFDEEDGAEIMIHDERHPLGAGLKGTVIATTGSVSMAWGHPAPMAMRIAGLSRNPAKFVVFAYEKGTAMVGRTAPAKRVGFFATDGAAARFTPDGLRLFDASIDWATAP